MALICNLVQEFNGLVSKGSIERLALLLFKNYEKINSLFALLSSRFNDHFLFNLDDIDYQFGYRHQHLSYSFIFI